MSKKMKINWHSFELSLLYATIIVCFYLAGCSENGNRSVSKKADKATVETSTVQPIQKPHTTFTDTLVIDNPAAVFFNPDSLQVACFKSIVSNNEFESMKHDCYFQQRNSRIVLKKDWPKIQIVEAAKVRYLIFRKADKSTTSIDLDKTGDMCGIFLFNTLKEPVLIDMMNVETSLDYYFNNK